ncbi:MAG: methyltransferase domain-containing protein [Pseudodesulfovibrio sp.]
MALGKGDVFVDVGCGAGDYSLAAAAIVGETGRVVALDQLQSSIDWLNARGRVPGAAGINGLVCDITDRLPLENGRADVAMLGTVLHIRWVREKADGLLAEIRRILRPGGMLAVLECKKEEADFGPPLHSRLSPEEVAALAAPLGFRKESERILEHTYLACFRAD